MLKHRIIPTLLWGEHGTVKPVAFARPARNVGSLMQAASVYEARDVDELILLDIEATAPRCAPRLDEVKAFTSRLFCPVTIGGGVRTCDDIRDLLRAGADKVAICTATQNLGFVLQASSKFGAQAIVAAIDVRSDGNVMFESGTQPYFKDCVDPIGWAETIEQSGAGEILLTDIARDGTMTGYNTDLIERVSRAVGIPVIANGGCGIPEHMHQAFAAGADACAAGSIFLFTEETPQTCKQHLHQQKIPVRLH